MTKVIFDTSMSLDGFMTAAGVRPEEPLGDGGQRLHEWAMGGDERSRRLLADAVGELGAAICGRRTYDQSLPWWGPDGPTGPARRPLVVVTHEPPAEAPPGGVYEFADGIASALERAKAAAAGATVCVMGGADVGRQFLAAGLVDEIQIHLVPVLFGGGTRMFEELAVDLEVLEVIEAEAATHLRYRVL
jgi:dihydrofolate reductase